MSYGTWAGYPKSYTVGRTREIQGVAIHGTAGSEAPTAAEAGAAYDKTRTDGTSTHAFADRDSCLVEVPDAHRAHHARAHGNEIFLGLELCGVPQTSAQWLDAGNPLPEGARWTADRCLAHGIPIRRLTVAQTRAAYYAPAGQRPKGIVGHVDITQAFPEDGGDHMDPWPGFPWDTFLAMVVSEARKTIGGGDMPKLVIINDRPGGQRGETYACDGNTWRGFSTWAEAQRYAAWWGTPDTNLPVVAWADVPLLLGVSLASLQQGGGSAPVLVPHTHPLSVSVGITGSGSGSGTSGQAVPTS